MTVAKDWPNPSLLHRFQLDIALFDDSGWNFEAAITDFYFESLWNQFLCRQPLGGEFFPDIDAYRAVAPPVLLFRFLGWDNAKSDHIFPTAKVLFVLIQSNLAMRFRGHDGILPLPLT